MEDPSLFFSQLQVLIEQERFKELESDTIELMPFQSTGQSWGEHFISVDAFLNTRGRLLVLGIEEEGQGNHRNIDQSDVRGFDLFYRKARNIFNKLEALGFIVREPVRGGKGFGFVLSSAARRTQKTCSSHYLIPIKTRC